MKTNPELQKLLDLPGLNAVIVEDQVRVTFLAESHVSLEALEADPVPVFLSLHKQMRDNIDVAFEHRMQLINQVRDVKEDV